MPERGVGLRRGVPEPSLLHERSRQLRILRRRLSIRRARHMSGRTDLHQRSMRIRAGSGRNGLQCGRRRMHGRRSLPGRDMRRRDPTGMPVLPGVRWGSMQPGIDRRALRHSLLWRCLLSGRADVRWWSLPGDLRPVRGDVRSGDGRVLPGRAKRVRADLRRRAHLLPFAGWRLRGQLRLLRPRHVRFRGGDLLPRTRRELRERRVLLRAAGLRRGRLLPAHRERDLRGRRRVLR